MNSCKYFLTIFFSLSFISACTIGVGRDTDGSAVLWKNRDQAYYYTSTVEYINNSEDDSILYNYTQVTTYGYSSPYMGMNERGFAIVNSLVQSDDDIQIPRTIDDEYELIREALGQCQTISEFESLVYTLLPTYSGENHILSNFAVIDKNGDGAIFEIDTYSDSTLVLIQRDDLGNGETAIFRSNHFKNLENPASLASLDIYNCDSLTMSSDLLKGNARRWCSSRDYFDNLDLGGNSIIKYLIEADPTLNGDKGPLLRSLSRSNPSLNSEDSNSEDSFYKLPYRFQITSDCGKGRPAGYIYPVYSIARNKTTSSVIMKSIPDDTTMSSFMLVALGNPLFTPYIPIKISDFEDIENFATQYHNFSSNSSSLYDYIFDYIKDSTEWLDTQHLVPTILTSYPNPNHDGTFYAIKNIEDSIDFSTGTVSNTFLSDINAYYDTYITGFSTGSYDEPLYCVKILHYDWDPNCTNRIDYSFKEFENRTFHIDFSLNHTWELRDIYSGDSFTLVNPIDIFNPMIDKQDWDDLNIGGDFSVVDLYYNNYEVRDSISLGCTNSIDIKYDENADVDNGSCAYFYSIIDMNSDGLLNVLDVISLVNIILNGDDYILLGDINSDGQLNILDVVALISIIMSN
ncbi:hypothetical protein EB821_05615 [Candidatus Marinimicrobia bacterium PRS2]|nr:hypothetical protein EB821_05615 [Candidatus Marinimicrobia bacterium PRS2]